VVEVYAEVEVASILVTWRWETDAKRGYERIRPGGDGRIKED